MAGAAAPAAAAARRRRACRAPIASAGSLMSKAGLLRNACILAAGKGREALRGAFATAVRPEGGVNWHGAECASGARCRERVAECGAMRACAICKRVRALLWPLGAACAMVPCSNRSPSLALPVRLRGSNECCLRWRPLAGRAARSRRGRPTPPLLLPPPVPPPRRAGGWREQEQAWLTSAASWLEMGQQLGCICGTRRRGSTSLDEPSVPDPRPRPAGGTRHWSRTSTPAHRSGERRVCGRGDLRVVNPLRSGLAACLADCARPARCRPGCRPAAVVRLLQQAGADQGVACTTTTLLLFLTRVTGLLSMPGLFAPALAVGQNRAGAAAARASLAARPPTWQVRVCGHICLRWHVRRCGRSAHATPRRTLHPGGRPALQAGSPPRSKQAETVSAEHLTAAQSLHVAHKASHASSREPRAGAGTDRPAVLSARRVLPELLPAWCKAFPHGLPASRQPAAVAAHHRRRLRPLAP